MDNFFSLLSIAFSEVRRSIYLQCLEFGIFSGYSHF